MSDIVERLRKVSQFGGTHLDGLWTEAADAIVRLHKIEVQFLALKEERVRWRTDNEMLTRDNDRLRAALQDIAEDPYAVDGGAADVARKALAGR
jgi:type II secretory pathway component PulJ